MAIYYIYTGDSMTQRALADKLSVKEPTVVRLIQKMEQENILTSFGTDEDKRIKQLALTGKGIRLFHDLLPVAEKFKNDTIAGIGEEDLQILKNTLNTMVSNALRNRL
jgi:DNA-binding MarR family transcriptional regulator